MTYGNLVKLDTNNNVIPDLSTGWKVGNGGKTYTFTLRDTKFSDGKLRHRRRCRLLDRPCAQPQGAGGQSPSPVASTTFGHIVGATSYRGAAMSKVPRR
jgi:ABC-type transport system substrate-binding protein